MRSRPQHQNSTGRLEPDPEKRREDATPEISRFTLLQTVVVRFALLSASGFGDANSEGTCD